MKEEIIFFNQYFATVESMDDRQKRCYHKITELLDKGIYVDVGQSKSYIYVYIEEQIGKILDSGLKVIDNIINKLIVLDKIYCNDNHDYKINWYIGDLLCLKGDFAHSLNYYRLNPAKIRTHDTNHILNIKYELKIDVSPVEMLSINKKITKFGIAHINNILKYCNIILQKEKQEKKMDYLQYIGYKYQKEKTSAFRLHYLGYNINELFYKQNYQFSELCSSPNFPQFKYIKSYSFYAIEEFYRFCEELSRSAENLLREDYNMPRVGERWISETELYYFIKSYLKDIDVIHHYSSKWLGKQRLDIFIPKYNIGFEYQGKQHFEPVEYFGGEKAFKENQRRDKQKIEKCLKNNVKLFYVKEGYDFDDIKLILDDYKI